MCVFPNTQFSRGEMSVHLSFLKRSFINLTIKCSQSRSTVRKLTSNSAPSPPRALASHGSRGQARGEGCGEIRMWGSSRRFCNANSQLAAESGEEVPPLKTPHYLQRPLGQEATFNRFPVPSKFQWERSTPRASKWDCI